jgi:hypothetical protein
LGLDDGVVGTGAVAGDGDAERDDARGARESGCEAWESGRHFFNIDWTLEIELEAGEIEHSRNEIKELKRSMLKLSGSVSKLAGKALHPLWGTEVCRG